MFTSRFARRKIVRAKGGAPLKPRDAGTWLFSWLLGGGMPAKKTKDKKDKVVAFRVSSSDFEIFDKKLASSKMSKSEFFREVFLNSNVSLTVKAAPSKDHSALLFLYNKSSNNLNQLARQVNIAHLSGAINRDRYLRYMNALLEIRDLMLAGISHVD